MHAAQTAYYKRLGHGIHDEDYDAYVQGFVDALSAVAEIPIGHDGRTEAFEAIMAFCDQVTLDNPLPN